MSHFLNKKQEIWLTVDSRHFGGIETHLYQLATGLVKTGYHPRIVFLRDYGKHPLRKALQKAEIPITTLTHPLRGWKEAISHYKPALIHTHGYKAGILGRLAAYRNNIACVSTYHSGDANNGRLKCYRWFDEHTASLAQKVIAISENVAARLPSHAAIIPNFVPVPSDITEHTGKHIAFVGRLSHEKGPDYFVELAKSLPQHLFTVYGDGPMRETLDVVENLNFIGQVDSMEPHWQKIDLLIMPSRREGLPLAALESMAHRIPVIASAVGGLPSLIQDKENGFLVETGNLAELSKIASHWYQLDEVTRQTICQKAQQTVREQYSPEVILPQIIQQYEEAYAHRHPTR